MYKWVEDDSSNYIKIFSTLSKYQNPLKLWLKQNERNCFFSVQKEKGSKKMTVVIYMDRHTYWLCLMGYNDVSGQGTENDTEWTGFLQCFVSEAEPLAGAVSASCTFTCCILLRFVLMVLWGFQNLILYVNVTCSHVCYRTPEKPIVKNNSFLFALLTLT